MEPMPILDGPGKPPIKKRWWTAVIVIWVMTVSLVTMILENIYPGSKWVSYVPTVGVFILVTVGLMAWAKRDND